MNDDLLIVDEQFRIANYLSCAQLYLKDNPLLKRKLTINDIKSKLVGHWGSAPGQNFIYAHLNRIITKYDLSCPIDKIKKKITIEESSFIEISNNNTLVNNPMIKEGLKYQLSIFNEYIIKSLEINNKLDKLLKEYDSIYKIIEKNKKEEEKITLLQEKVEWIKKQKEIQEKRQNSKKYKDISNSLNP